MGAEGFEKTVAVKRMLAGRESLQSRASMFFEEARTQVGAATSDGHVLAEESFDTPAEHEEALRLMAVPRARVRDIYAHAGLDRTYRDGALSTEIAVTPSRQAMAVRIDRAAES